MHRFPHFTRTPTTSSLIFHSHILYVYNPALPHFTNTHNYHRHLADGMGTSTVPAASPIKYVFGYRSWTRTLNPKPNPKTDPNTKNNKKENNTGMKLNIVISKSRFRRDGGRVYKRPITGNGTHMDLPVF